MIKKFFLSSIILLLITAVCYATENPCNGADPDDTTPCPLDTWVIILVVAALAFATTRLYNKQKAALNAA